MVEASPNFGLPAAVDIFDGRLKATLLWPREDRSNPEPQAGPHDEAERILTVVAPMEDGVVVDGIGRQSEFAPVSTSASTAVLRSPASAATSPASPVQGDHIEDLQTETPFQSEPLDGIEAVEFSASVLAVGEMPAWRGRKVEARVAGHPTHLGVRGFDRWCAPRAPSRLLVSLARGGEPERRTRPDYSSPSARGAGSTRHLLPRISSTSPSGNRRMVAPIDLLQGPLPGSSQPPLHGRQAHLLSPCHGSHRGAVPNRCHHGTPPVLLRRGPFYSSHLTPKCFLQA